MAPIPLYDDQELLQKIAQGDQLAFKLLYQNWNKKIYTFSFGILQSDELAAELVQETMLKLWLMGPGLCKIQNLDAFLKTITRNRAIDMLRRQELVLKAEQELGYHWQETHNETEEQILLNEARKVLRDGIACMPEQHRVVYRLCHQEGLKYEEAARQLNLSPSTIQTYMKLSLRFLRKYMSTHGDVAILFILFNLF